MVAMPTLTPRTQSAPARPGQPIALPQRSPRDSAPWPSLAPSQSTSHLPSPSSEEPHPPTPPAQQQPDGDEVAAAEEEASPYSPLLKEHVFALYCAGQRSPAIAAQLGISERTVRHWVRATLQQLAQDDVTASPDAARQQRALAIESQRAASASAWATYHRLTAAHSQLLDLALMASMRQQSDPVENAPQPDTAAVVSDPQHLFVTAQRIASSAARYLALVISANREIAHLQGHATAQDARERHATAQDARERHATAARDAADARQLEADLIRAFTTPILPPEPASRHASPYNPWPADDIAALRPLPTGAAPNTAPTHPDTNISYTDPLIAALRASLQATPAPATQPLAAHPASRMELTAKSPPPPHPPTVPATPTPRITQSASAAKMAMPLPVTQAAMQPEIAAKTATPLAAAPSTSQPKIAAKTATPTAPRATALTSRPDPTPKTRQGAKPTPRATSQPPHPRRQASAKRNKPQLILPPKP